MPDLQKSRAQPDWAHEFPDRTGPDNQICRTGPAGPDWIRTYIFKPCTYQIQVINSHKISSLDTTLVSKVNKQKNEVFYLFFKVLNVWEGKRPVSRQLGLWKLARLPDLTWCSYPNHRKLGLQIFSKYSFLNSHQQVLRQQDDNDCCYISLFCQICKFVHSL